MDEDNRKFRIVRDGTSQAERSLPELDPNSAKIDERTTQDMLAFARGYARMLKFITPDQSIGELDWREFISDNIDLDDVARYLKEPDIFSKEKSHIYSRPHFALFLVFIHLLDKTRIELNKFTHRHLEYFYRDILKLQRRGEKPDQVHVLIDLESGTNEQLLPKATALSAGKDNNGETLIYRTEKELVANKIEIQQLSSLYIDTQKTGIRDACTPNMTGENREQGFVEMLKIVLGQPASGDPLPTPIYTGLPTGTREIDFADLIQAYNLIAEVKNQLGMPLFDDFRNLVFWEQQRGTNEAKDWKAINSILETAGNITITPSDSNEFINNLTEVIKPKDGSTIDNLFDGVPEVENVEDAYNACINRTDEADVIAAIETALIPISLDDFKSMMSIKRKMDNEWEEINTILEKAALYLNGDFQWPTGVRDEHDFNGKLEATCPNFKPEGGLAAFHKNFLDVENYFYMPAESYKYIIEVAKKEDSNSDTNKVRLENIKNWDNVYKIVESAHIEMIYTRRREILREVSQEDIDKGDNVKAVTDLLNFVLGETLKPDVAIKELGGLQVSQNFQDELTNIIDSKGDVDIDWDKIYKVLEVAQRNREHLPEQVAEKIVWRNIYPAENAQDVIALAADTQSDKLIRWNTFGAASSNDSKDKPPGPTMGWAIESSILSVSEGKRTISLSLSFSNKPEFYDRNSIESLFSGQSGVEFPFLIQLSTSKGWLDIEPNKVSLEEKALNILDDSEKTISTQSLNLELVLPAGHPAIAPLADSGDGASMSSPVLRLMLKPIWKETDKCYTTSSYKYLRQLRILHTKLKVDVKNLSSLTIANDVSILNSKKPFEPFGSKPATGSRFYLGHPEVVYKQLSSLSFNVTWMGLQASLEKNYENYGDDIKLNNTSFKANVGMVCDGVVTNFSEPLTLFSKNDARTPISNTLAPPEDQGSPQFRQENSEDITDWSRMLQWELIDPDFQHDVYPIRVMQKSQELAFAIANKNTTQNSDGTQDNLQQYQLSPPYTPKIKSLTLDYSAVVEQVMFGPDNKDKGVESYHVEPFGFSKCHTENDPDGTPFLPQFDFEGELYIGLKNVTAPQNLSLLFQTAEGSADADLTPQPITWSYLNADNWCSLQDEGCILSDSTNGLINSGIVELMLKPVKPSTRMPRDLYWIRLAIRRFSRSVCDMVSIHPNAVLATLDSQNVSSEHLASPLASESISHTLIPIPGIAKLEQPYTSFGGKQAEQDKQFYIRVSERLRHKNRALTPWDYERLVLEEFPQIYKVKCLSADPITHPDNPGNVTLVVVPDIKKRLPFNPYDPKVPSDQIKKIQNFLERRCSLFARANVKNAQFIPIKVRCGISFKEGVDTEFYRRRLNQELNRFLMPWAYEEGADIIIGGSIYANSIINFIDSRDYVDYIAGFKLFYGKEETFIVPTMDAYCVTAQQSDQVLVAAQEHVFDLISGTDYRLEEFTGINYMKIELDFTVS